MTVKQRSKRGVTLAIVIVTLLAVLASVAMSKVYTEPLLYTDTIGYIFSALGDRWSNAFRTSGYGTIMLLGSDHGMPWLFFYIQIASWIACITLASAITGILLRSVTATLSTGLLLLVMELSVMHTLPAQWTAMTDPLYADWMTLGILLMIFGAILKRPWPFFLAAALVGSATLIRPILIGIPILAVAGVITMPASKKVWLRSLCIAVFILLLAGPIALRSGFNYFLIGRSQPTPLIGQHLVTYASALYEPGDRVFADPVINDAFAEMMRTGIPPAGFRAKNLLFSTNPIWESMLEFYASLTPENRRDLGQFTTTAVSKAVGLRLISLHPLRYLRLATKEFFELLIPSLEDRLKFWEPDIEQHYNYVITSCHINVAHRVRFQIGTAFRNIDYRPGIARMINVLPLHLRLPKKAGTVSITAAIIGLIFVLGAGLSLVKMPEQRLRLLGWAILLCEMNTVVHLLVQSAITQITDARFLLSGMLTMEIAIALTVVSLPSVVRTFFGTHARQARS